MEPIKILFIDGTSSGTGSHILVPGGTTVGGFFNEKFPGKDTKNYKVRVNGVEVNLADAESAAYTFRDNDRFTVIPNNIKGASDPVKILFIDGTSSGTGSHILVAGGTTVGGFFNEKFPGKDTKNYKVRVNGIETNLADADSASYVFRDNDRFTVVPNNIKGA